MKYSRLLNEAIDRINKQYAKVKSGKNMEGDMKNKQRLSTDNFRTGKDPFNNVGSPWSSPSLKQIHKAKRQYVSTVTKNLTVVPTKQDSGGSK